MTDHIGRQAGNEQHPSIHIDKKQFHAPRSEMTGADLKQLAGIDVAFRLFRQTPGNDPDVPISDNETVALKNGDHFYSLPIGRVGGETTSIHIDKKQFHAPRSNMTGLELKQLAGTDPAFRLFRQTPGNDPDVPISDNETIALKNGDHFYSLPIGRVGDDLLPSVREELDEVTAAYPGAQVHRASGTPEMWIEVSSALPSGKGWTPPTTSIVLPVPTGYPTAKPPNFFVASGLTRGGGAVGGMGAAQTIGAIPGTWCPMCWGPEKEGRTTLLSYVRFALSRFQEAQ
jgi:hypothetical protein